MVECGAALGRGTLCSTEQTKVGSNWSDCGLGTARSDHVSLEMYQDISVYQCAISEFSSTPNRHLECPHAAGMQIAVPLHVVPQPLQGQPLRLRSRVATARVHFRRLQDDANELNGAGAADVSISAGACTSCIRLPRSHLMNASRSHAAHVRMQNADPAGYRLRGLKDSRLTYGRLSQCHSHLHRGDSGI